MAQIIAVAVLFSDESRFTGFIIDAMKKLMPDYGVAGKDSATAVWNVLMGVSYLKSTLNVSVGGKMF